MIPGESKRPAPGRAARIEKALDRALKDTIPASDAINLRQWNELEAVEKARAEREAQMKDVSAVDRALRYARGPTSFSA